MNTIELETDHREECSYFGRCPDCLNEGHSVTLRNQTQWMYCEACRTCWCIGWGLFSVPPEFDTDECYRENAERLRGCRIVEPHHCYDKHPGKPTYTELSTERWLKRHERDDAAGSPPCER